MNTVIPHLKAAQALHGVRLLHPAAMSDELTARLMAKMEALACEAYLEGRKRGLREGWLNGATIALALSLLAVALGQSNVAINTWHFLVEKASDLL